MVQAMTGGYRGESIITSLLVAIVIVDGEWRKGEWKQKRWLGIIMGLMMRRKGDKIIRCRFMAGTVAKKESRTTGAVEY